MVVDIVKLLDIVCQPVLVHSNATGDMGVIWLTQKGQDKLRLTGDGIDLSG